MTRLKDHRILVVEDEFYLARDVQRALKREGASILGPFSDQRGALDAMDRDRPDCAIIDVNLGQGVEFGLADALVAREIPFLFLTGYDREVIPARFSHVTRLEKPVELTRLVSAAAVVCDGAACETA